MKIGVLSDTHIPGKAATLPPIITEAFNTVGHIIHAGDICSLSVLRSLEALAPVTAVAGNVDPPDLQEMLGFKKIIDLGGFKFGVVHGHGTGSKTLDRVSAAFINESVDCIVFGHSHITYCGYHGQTLLLNPGSPTDKRRNEFYSFGIIEVYDTIKPQIIYFGPQGIVTKTFSYP